MYNDSKIKDQEQIKKLLNEILYEYPLLSTAPTDACGTFKAADKFGNIYLVHLFGEPRIDDQERYYYKRRTELKYDYKDALIAAAGSVNASDVTDGLPSPPKRKRIL